MIYPALAILAALALDRARRALEPRLGATVAAVLLAAPALVAGALGLSAGGALLLDTPGVP